MTISTGQITVSNVPIAIHAADDDGVLIVINATQNIYVGKGDVSASTGYLHAKQDPPLHLDLGPGEILYAIRAGEVDATITTLRTHNV